MWQRIFDRADVVVVDVRGSDIDNLAIADVALDDPLPMIDTPAIVNATIANLGALRNETSACNYCSSGHRPGPSRRIPSSS